MDDKSFVDYYEVLQLSPKADSETIQRIYRSLAQRFHPDNADTGHVEAFRQISEAFRILSDPDRRAAYDVRHARERGIRWKIFNQPAAASGMEAEKRKRLGILSLLYTKRMSEPRQPELSLMELEDLLGCPREHLEFSLWYLREMQCIQRSDNARHVITVKGVDTMEGVEQEESPLREQYLLRAPATQQSQNGS